MSTLEAVYPQVQQRTSPLGEVEEREALPGEGQASLPLARHPVFDGPLLALAIGLALWFLCATMVISTFVHPGMPS